MGMYSGFVVKAIVKYVALIVEDSVDPRRSSNLALHPYTKCIS